MASQAKGNGTYTTYAYGACRAVIHLVNYAPMAQSSRGLITATMAQGNVTAMATLDGQWSYEYDLAGQLTHAVFES